MFLDQATTNLKYIYSVLAQNIKWNLPNNLILDDAGRDARLFEAVHESIVIMCIDTVLNKAPVRTAKQYVF